MDSYFFALYLFFTYSFLGWALESVYKSIHAKKFINSGFYKSPVCPIYGFGALLVLAVNTISSTIFSNSSPNFWVVLLSCTVFVTILEFLTGTYLLKAYNKRWWDYSDQKHNIKGHVCPRFTLYWCVLIAVFLKGIHPIVLSVSLVTPYKLKFLLFVPLGIELLYTKLLKPRLSAFRNYYYN